MAAVASLLLVSATILWIILGNMDDKKVARISTPTLTRTVLRSSPATTGLASYAHPRGRFDPNCPAGTHWTMSVSRCAPDWHPGEP